MKKKYPYRIVLLCCLLLLFACDEKREKPDVSDIQIKLSIQRFESDLMQADSNDMDGLDRKLMGMYPEFYPVFLDQILEIRKPFDTILMVNGRAEKKLLKPDAYKKDLKQFKTHPYIIALYDSVMEQYPELGFLEKDMTEGMRYFHYYFPKKPIPKIITFISEFGYASATIDSSFLLIGLDMYLGKQYPYYDEFFPEYMKAVLSKEYMVPNAFKAIYQQHFAAMESNSPQLIHRMIERGKELYFLDCVLPDVADYRKISYTEAQLKWCEDNEASVWDFFAEHDLFYIQDAFNVNKYISTGPTTAGMPAEAPGNIGSWVGWQIVRAYVEKSGAKPEDVFRTDPQRILSQADYKPDAR